MKGVATALGIEIEFGDEPAVKFVRIVHEKLRPARECGMRAKLRIAPSYSSGSTPPGGELPSGAYTLVSMGSKSTLRIGGIKCSSQISRLKS
jgi:hypothetical protein